MHLIRQLRKSGAPGTDILKLLDQELLLTNHIARLYVGLLALSPPCTLKKVLIGFRCPCAGTRDMRLCGVIGEHLPPCWFGCGVRNSCQADAVSKSSLNKSGQTCLQLIQQPTVPATVVPMQ